MSEPQNEALATSKSDNVTSGNLNTDQTLTFLPIQIYRAQSDATTAAIVPTAKALLPAHATL